MAGFAVFMTIITYGFVGLLVACSLSVCLFIAARRKVRREVLKGRTLTAISTLAPFLGLLWLAVALLLYIQISNRLAHQDCGLSGDPYVTLPNGYVVGSHNTYDGYFVAPGFHTDVPEAGPGYVRSLIDLQFTAPYFSGTLLDLKTYKVRRFIFDTRTRNFAFKDPVGPTSPILNYSDPAALDAFGTAQTHVHEDTDSYWRLYDRYRHHWPSFLLFLLISLGEGAIFLWVRTVWTKQTAGTT